MTGLALELFEVLATVGALGAVTVVLSLGSRR